MDWNPEFRKIGMEGVILVVDGPDQARSAARRLVKNGAQWIKTYPTGDAAAPGTNDHHTLSMTFEEMEAVVTVAHNHRRKVYGHCRATQGIKNALLAGYDSIEHGTFMDAECLDLMLERDVPCVPALYFELASIERGPEFGLSSEVIAGHQETLEGGAESARMIQQAGGCLGHGRRLRVRLEPSRRLREGAGVLRRLRRLHADGDARLRRPATAPGSWAGPTTSARSSRASSPTCWWSTAT